MKRKSIIQGFLLLSCGLVLTPIAVAQESGSDPVLEEVIVTAQRREESNQQVPISVSAFSGAEIERKQMINTVDSTLR